MLPFRGGNAGKARHVAAVRQRTRRISRTGQGGLGGNLAAAVKMAAIGLLIHQLMKSRAQGAAPAGQPEGGGPGDILGGFPSGGGAGRTAPGTQADGGGLLGSLGIGSPRRWLVEGGARA